MIIGRTRLTVGPLRDLGQLDAIVARIGRIPGVDAVGVEAFLERHVQLGVHVLRPMDLGVELAIALGDDLASCRVGTDRLEVELREGPRVRSSTERTTSSRAGRRPAPPGAPSGGGPWDAERAPSSLDDRPFGSRPEHPVAAVRERVAPGRALATLDPPRRRPVPGRPADVGELLDLSFRHGPVATALIAPDGRWLRVNRRLCELLGRDERTLLAGRLEDVTHPEDVHCDRGLGREAIDGLRDRYAVDKRYVRGDGRVVSARLEVSLVRDDDGAPRWFVFQVVDLGEVGSARPRLVAGSPAS